MHEKTRPTGGEPAGLTMGGTLPGGCVPIDIIAESGAVVKNLPDLAGLALGRADLALDLGNLDAAQRALAIAGAALQNGAGETFQAARRRYLLTQSRLYELTHGGDNGKN